MKILKRLLLCILYIILLPFVIMGAYIDILILLPLSGILWILTGKSWILDIYSSGITMFFAVKTPIYVEDKLKL